MGKFGIKGIWTSRGCAFPCPYCFNNRYNNLYKGKGKVVRRRSVDSVIRETKELISNYRVDFIRIQDDVFAYRVDDWLHEFAKRWSEEIKIPFYALIRSELVTNELAAVLKRAGCFSICMSIESADDYLRKKMMRRNVAREKLEDAFKILREYGINIYANTMLALPFSSIEQDIQNLDFVVKVKPDMPNFSIFMPYPGTDLGDYCRDKGIYKPDENDINYGMRNMSPLDCFSEKEKRAQYNICQLAIVAVKFPFLRNLIVNHLIWWKPNKAFFAIHYLVAIYSYGRKIFYFKHSPIEYIELFIKTIKHYLYDFTNNNEKKKMPECEILDGVVRFHPARKLSNTKRIEKLNECMRAMSQSNIYFKS